MALSGLVQAQEAAPSRPTGLVATPGDDRVTFSWDDPSDTSITGYEYQEQENGGVLTAWTPDPDSSATGPNSLSYTISGLANGTECTFVIRATNGQGASDQSSSATTTPLPKPARLSATPSDRHVVQIGADPSNHSIIGHQYRQSSSQRTGGNREWGEWSTICRRGPAVTFNVERPGEGGGPALVATMPAPLTRASHHNVAVQSEILERNRGLASPEHYVI